MDNKSINGSGLAHLWSKIKATFATKKELQDAIGDIPSGGGEGSSAVQEIEWVEGTYNLQSNSIETLTHSFGDIDQAFAIGKVVKIKLTVFTSSSTAIRICGNLITQGVEFDSLFSMTPKLFRFHFFINENFGGGVLLYSAVLTIYSSGEKSVSLKIVNTTNPS